MLAGHRGELVGMPEGELAQEDPQCRGRIHLIEDPGRAAGAQHVHIIDAVRAAQHATDNRGQLPGRIDRARGHPGAGQIDILADQPRKTGLLSQFHDRHQTSCRHQIGSSNTADPTVNVCEDCTGNAFRTRDHFDFSNRYCPRSEGIFAVHTPITNDRPSTDSG